MEQVVDFPSHIRRNILDLCLTSRPQNILTNIYLATSDHSFIQFDFKFSAKIIQTDELVRDWRTGDIDGLKNFLDTQDWEAKLCNKTQPTRPGLISPTILIKVQISFAFNKTQAALRPSLDEQTCKTNLQQEKKTLGNLS